MSDTPYRALVVDDEPIARRTVIWALSNEEFECIPATDGVDAIEKAKHTKFDLVVTDLCMPNKHGHALVTELLAGEIESMPVIVAHSHVDEPRITKDLMLRGVDDVVYKPTNYAAFAAKMKGLVIRRRLKRQTSSTVAFNAEFDAMLPRGEHDSKLAAPLAMISLKDFEARLADVSHILPVSTKSVEVMKLLSARDFDACSLEKIIGSDGVLTVEFLRAANSSQFARAGRKITELNEAILRLGAKRIGEISLAAGTLASLTKLVLPWFDKELASRRSQACCVAAKRILERQIPPGNEDGVVFSALVYPLARLVIGSAYASTYEMLLAECCRKSSSLQSLEQTVFPQTPAEATAQLLLNWGLPAELCEPLRRVDGAIDSQVNLTAAFRNSVKCLKSATLIGECAVGNWQPWEIKPDLPPDAFFKSIQIENVRGLINEVRDELEQ